MSPAGGQCLQGKRHASTGFNENLLKSNGLDIPRGSLSPKNQTPMATEVQPF
jgi:hypothetical protein